MKTFYARIVRSRWLTTLLGVLLLGLVVWFFGPLLAVGITRPLETELARGWRHRGLPAGLAGAGT